MEKIRNIKLFKNYYKEFYVAQTFEVRDKINKVLKLIETQRIIPAKFFRIIEGTDGIYEIRIELESNIYRYSVALTKEPSWYCSMVFRRKARRLPLRRSDAQKQLRKNILRKRRIRNDRREETGNHGLRDLR